MSIWDGYDDPLSPVRGEIEALKGEANRQVRHAYEEAVEILSLIVKQQGRYGSGSGSRVALIPMPLFEEAEAVLNRLREVNVR